MLTIQKITNRFHISLWLESFQGVCDRCFIGTSDVVVDVLSMIQCIRWKGRHGEKDVSPWMFGGNFQYIIH